MGMQKDCNSVDVMPLSGHVLSEEDMLWKAFVRLIQMDEGPHFHIDGSLISSQLYLSAILFSFCRIGRKNVDRVRQSLFFFVGDHFSISWK